MLKPDENEVWRVIINWLIPTSILSAVIQVATRALKHDITWTGALLTAIVSIGIGVILGGLLYYNFGLYPGLIGSSLGGMTGRDISKWIVYDSKIEKLISELFKYAAKKLRDWFK